MPHCQWPLLRQCEFSAVCYSRLSSVFSSAFDIVHELQLSTPKYPKYFWSPSRLSSGARKFILINFVGLQTETLQCVFSKGERSSSLIVLYSVRSTTRVLCLCADWLAFAASVWSSHLWFIRKVVQQASIRWIQCLSHMTGNLVDFEASQKLQDKLSSSTPNLKAATN